jgi:hypothetical protein
LLKEGTYRNFAAAMGKAKQRKSLPKRSFEPLIEGWTFTRKNYLLFGIGLLFIILGYIVMATGEVNSFQSLTLAPIMLFIGYIVLIPIALIYRDPAGSDRRAREKV